MPGFFSNFASRYGDNVGAEKQLDKIEKTQKISNKNQVNTKKAKKKVIKASTDTPLPKKKKSAFGLSDEAVRRRREDNARERKRLLAE